MSNTDEKLIILADSYVDLVKEAKDSEDIKSLLRTLALRAALAEVDSMREKLK
jgi:hypothetical protein